MLKFIKLLSVFLCLFVLPSTLFAQKNIYQKAKFAAGFKGIVTYPTVAFDPAVSQALFQTTGYGLIFKHFTEKTFGFQLEINNTTKGWKETFGGEELYHRNVQYLEIPLLTHIYLGKKNIQIFVTLGTQFNYLIEESLTPTELIDEQRYDYSDRPLNTWVWDIAFGGGMNFITPIGHFQIEGKFGRSLTDIFKRPDRTSTEASYLQVTNISLAYLIPISGWKNQPQEDTESQIKFKTGK